MVVDPAVAVQLAQFALLDGQVGDGVAVYDRVPPNAVPSYVVIGDDSIVEDSADGYDGEYVTTNVHAWSRAVGKIDVKTIAGTVRARLSCNLDTEANGVRCVCWLYQRTRFLDDPDGVTKHAIVTLRYGTEPV